MSLERYSKIVEWARKRYTRGGILVLAEAGMVPSVYSRIEAAAWNKWLSGFPCGFLHCALWSENGLTCGKRAHEP